MIAAVIASAPPALGQGPAGRLETNGPTPHSAGAAPHGGGADPAELIYADPFVEGAIVPPVPAVPSSQPAPRGRAIPPTRSARHGDDPLAVEETRDLGDFDPEAIDPARPPRIAMVPPIRGPVLTAIAGVRETSHDLDIELADGLAMVVTKMTFHNTARHQAEITYRLPVPEEARLAGLEVCIDSDCRPGVPSRNGAAMRIYDRATRARCLLPEGSSPAAPSMAPIGFLRTVDDEQGHGLVLHAAPVALGSDLEVTVSYLVDATMIGGAVLLALPARGRDGRIAPAAVAARSRQSDVEVRIDDSIASGKITLDPWMPIEVTARHRRGEVAVAPRLSATTFPCAFDPRRRCGRVVATAPPRPPAVREVVLLIDASPSMEGAPRGRLIPTVLALLSQLDAETPVRALAFAARARWLWDGSLPSAGVPSDRLAGALEVDLGSATRFAAVATALGDLPRGARAPLIVWLGDGGLSDSPTEGRSLRAATQIRAPWAFVNLADRPTSPALLAVARQTGGAAIPLGRAMAAGGVREQDALIERYVAGLLAPVVASRVQATVGDTRWSLGTLRAGETVAWEGTLDRAASLSVQAGAARARARSIRGDWAVGLGARSAGERAAALVLLAVAAGDAPPTGRVLAPGVPSSREEQAASGAQPRPAQDHRHPGAGPDGRNGSADDGADGLPAAMESGVNRDDDGLALSHGTGSQGMGCAPGAMDCDPARRGRRRADRPDSTAVDSTAADAMGEVAGGSPTGVPAETVLTALRQRIVPAAGCFRRDRAGRTDYSVRAIFDLLLADREVAAAQVRGNFPPSLRHCLEATVDAIDVPRFDGTVRVRYPLYTAREAPPPTVELIPDVAARLDAVIGSDP